MPFTSQVAKVPASLDATAYTVTQTCDDSSLLTIREAVEDGVEQARARGIEPKEATVTVSADPQGNPTVVVKFTALNSATEAQ